METTVFNISPVPHEIPIPEVELPDGEATIQGAAAYDVSPKWISADLLQLKYSQGTIHLACETSGTAVFQVYRKPGTSTTLELVSWLGKTAKELAQDADRELNEAYTRLRDQRSSDTRSQLQKAQRAWLKYRDAQLEDYPRNSGKWYRALTQLTAHRTGEFKLLTQLSHPTSLDPQLGQDFSKHKLSGGTSPDGKLQVVLAEPEGNCGCELQICDARNEVVLYRLFPFAECRECDPDETHCLWNHNNSAVAVYDYDDTLIIDTLSSVGVCMYLGPNVNTVYSGRNNRFLSSSQPEQWLNEKELLLKKPASQFPERDESSVTVQLRRTGQSTFIKVLDENLDKEGLGVLQKRGADLAKLLDQLRRENPTQYDAQQHYQSAWQEWRDSEAAMFGEPESLEYISIATMLTDSRLEEIQATRSRADH